MNMDAFFESHSDLRRYADLVVAPPTRSELVSSFPEVEGDGEFDKDAYTTSPPLTKFALYAISRKNGNSHPFAAMVACQRAARVVTDDVFWAGRPHFAQLYGENYYQDVKTALASQGVSLGAHDEYCPELARYKGDPEAVISRARGRSYIKSLCEKRGWACEGMVSVNGRQPDRDPMENSVPLAEDLIAENTQRMIQKNPELTRKSRRELREMVIGKHGSS